MFRRIACAATTAASLLAAGCIAVDSDGPTPNPPAPTFVWIDSPQTVVDGEAVYLRGETECAGCPPASGWQYMTCPAIACPGSPGFDVDWTNQITTKCNCPMFFYDYCYSACDHVWWATVPLAFGENRVEVSATAPGFAIGTVTATIERVPKAPQWLASEVGPGQVTLSWTAVEGATSYKLYWSTTPWAYSSLCENQIEAASSPYTHTGLASGDTYYYFVTASSGGAESFDSARLTATPE
jgi:hypothetical protein